MIGRSVNPEEQGSALVIALIFIGVWAVVIMAVLGLAETGFNLAAGTADQRDGAYAADGAVMAAIFSTRTYLEGYGDPVACPPLRFTQTENPGEADEELLDVLGQIDAPMLRSNLRGSPTKLGAASATAASLGSMIPATTPETETIRSSSSTAETYEFVTIR